MLAGLDADRIRMTDLEAETLELERSLSELRATKVLAQEQLESYNYPKSSRSFSSVSCQATPFVHRFPGFSPQFF
jgi:hypothetical protein